MEASLPRSTTTNVLCEQGKTFNCVSLLNDMVEYNMIANEIRPSNCVQNDESYTEQTFRHTLKVTTTFWIAQPLFEEIYLYYLFI